MPAKRKRKEASTQPIATPPSTKESTPSKKVKTTKQAKTQVSLKTGGKNDRYVAPLSKPSLELKGKVCVVTGSTQGLGASIAITLASLGAHALVITGRDCDPNGKVSKIVKQINSYGCKTLLVAADLSNEGQIRNIITSIDCLVNAAGCTFCGGLFNTDSALFDHMFTVNTKAPFILMQEAAKLMQKQGGGGSIVNISSKSAHGGQPFLTTYCASKAALDCITKNAAQSLKSDGIRINGVMLGWTYTENEHKTQVAESPHGEQWLEEADKGFAANFGRMLRPDDVTPLVAFLLSDASTMITGGLHNIFPEENVPGCY